MRHAKLPVAGKWNCCRGSA